MTSLTVFHGSVWPNFCDSAVAMDRAVAVPSDQASGRFSGSISAAAIMAGGWRRIAFDVRTPAGIGSASTLAGPLTSHNAPPSTAAVMALLITSAPVLGMETGSM